MSLGLGEPGRASGLDNMRHRAAEFGGGFSVGAAEPHGTVVTWRVPI
jgi:signal transduction histidine kinase